MEQVRRTGADNQDQWEFKTRCYYSSYVYHMIRFYLSTPETLQMDGKRKADIDNWLAVQEVWHKLGTDEKKVLAEIFKMSYAVKNHSVSNTIRLYCEEKGTDLIKTGSLVARTCAAIAKRRGLI